MDFPSLPIAAPVNPVRLDGYIPVRATNGALNVRKLMEGEKMEFPFVVLLTAAQRTELETHYQDHKYLSFNFLWSDGVTYVVQYMSAPLHVPQPGGWYRSQVRLGEV